jgi:UDPglucose 6-dehydrogenase
MKIGIVGNGFVGSSVAYGFSLHTGFNAEIKIYDKNSQKSTHSLEDVVNDSDFVFVSVPTPSNKDHSINLDIVNGIFYEMNSLIKNTETIFLLRSTVTPGTTHRVQKKCPNLKIVFNPEFLTERSAKFDFINQSRFILGGEPENTQRVADLFRQRFGFATPIIQTNYETAEMIKYMNNCFFATKVIFLNEMRQIADLSGVNWNVAIEGFVRDGRVGHSHISVPGPDGHYGFGGSCFPKDMRAMISYAKSLGIEPLVLESAWNKNLEVREDRNWLKMPGRAITYEDDDS